jgi:hypothetical protein
MEIVSDSVGDAEVQRVGRFDSLGVLRQWSAAAALDDLLGDLGLLGVRVRDHHGLALRVILL